MNDSTLNRAHYDDDAIAFLAGRIESDDTGSSSHWRAMHSAFRFDGAPSGVRGLGTFRPSSHRLANIAHRVLQQPWRRYGSHLPDFPRIESIARQIAERQRRIYNLDVMRQALSVAYIAQKAPQVFTRGSTLLVIGDGFGTLTTTALAAYPGVRAILINLRKSLLVDLFYIKRAMPHERCVLATDARSFGLSLSDSSARIIAVQADDVQLLRPADVSIAVNIASMQEMNPEVIREYFDVLRGMPHPPLLYCCNREEKHLPDGTTTRFMDYPWDSRDRILDHGRCPWTQRYYSPRPPFVHPYDGPVLHRLAELAACGEGA